MLDLKLAAADDTELGGHSFNLYSTRLRQKTTLQTQIQAQDGYWSAAEQLATYLSVHLPDPEENSTLIALRKEVAAARKKSEEMVHKTFHIPT